MTLTPASYSTRSASLLMIAAFAGMIVGSLMPQRLRNRHEPRSIFGITHEVEGAGGARYVVDIGEDPGGEALPRLDHSRNGRAEHERFGVEI